MGFTQKLGSKYSKKKKKNYACLLVKKNLEKKLPLSLMIAIK